jgi:hypothetical protein
MVAIKLANLVKGITLVIVLLLVMRFVIETLSMFKESEFAKIVFSSTDHFRTPLLHAYEWLGVLDNHENLLTFLTIVVYVIAGFLISGIIRSLGTRE